MAQDTNQEVKSIGGKLKMSNGQEELPLEKVLKLRGKIKIDDWQESGGLYGAKIDRLMVYLGKKSTHDLDGEIGFVKVDYNKINLANYTGEDDRRVNEWYCSVKKEIDDTRNAGREEALRQARGILDNL